MTQSATDPVDVNGPEPDLKRVMGPKLLLLFIVGDILGAGIYAVTGQMALEVGGIVWLPFLVAFVVAPTLSARQITGALRRDVESAFVPRRVVHVERLPREATGKLSTQRLREFALQTLAHHEK